MTWWDIVLRLAVFILLEHQPPGQIFKFNELFGAIVKLTNGGQMIEVTNLRSNMTEDIIQKCGYRQETHRVVTDDGYILTLHRIPAEDNNSDSDNSDSDNGNDNSTTTTVTSKSPPILMIHGFLGDGLTNVIKGNHSSPAFIFNEAGYDVWLINIRGTRYSRKHVTLDPDIDRQFWNFSFHEMGIYDVPASVKYILSTTNTDQLYLVGHSMGGASSSIFLSEIPEYASKVKALFLWAPAIGMGRTKFPLATHLRGFTEALLDLCNDMEVMPFSHNLTILFRHQCMSYYGIQACDWLVQQLTGIAYPYKQETYFESTALMHAGTSVKVARHFLQMVDKNDFSQYDYGPKNFQKYQKENPPPYNLSKITVPTWIMFSSDDTIVNSTDIVEAAPQFPNAKLIHLERPPELPAFSHIDFICGEDIKIMVCDPMLREMSKLEGKDGIQRLRLFAYVAIASLAAILTLGLLTYFARRNSFRMY